MAALSNTASSKLRHNGVQPHSRFVGKDPTSIYRILSEETPGLSSSGLNESALRKAFQIEDKELDEGTFAEVWRVADADNNGFVDAAEFKQLYNRLRVKKVNDEIAQLRAATGVASAGSRATSAVTRAGGGSGGAAMARTTSQQEAERLRREGVSPRKDYANMDPNRAYKELQNLYSCGSGGLDQEALRKAVSVNGEDPDPDTFARVWKLADKDGDGSVSAEELKSLYCHLRLREVQQENEQLKKDLGMSAEEEARMRAAMAAKKKALQEKTAVTAAT